MEELICVICSEEYEALIVIPVVLPLCGHTFCRPCLVSITSRTGGLECPTCRKPHKDQRPALLPTNYALINLVDTKNKNKQESKCDTHNDAVQFWCKVCDQQLCGLCLFENHMAHGDKVSKITEFISMEKAEIRAKGQHHATKLTERKSHSCRKFIQGLLEVVRNRTNEQLLNQCISQVEKPLDVNQILSLRSKMDQIINEQELVIASSSGRDLSPRIVIRKKPRLKQNSFIDLDNVVDKEKESQVPKNADLSDQDIMTIFKLPSLTNNGHNSCTNDGPGPAPKKRKWNALEEEGSTSELDNRLLEFQKPDYTLAFGKTSTNTNEEICSFYQKSSMTYASLIWKNQRFHLNALSPSIRGQIKIDISVLQEYLSNYDHVEVFMELSESNMRDCIVPLGNVYIRIDARTRNGQQFLAMCLGTLGGLSYKGTMFNGVCEEGRGLWCGQYCDGVRWTDKATVNYLGHKDRKQIKPGLVRLHKEAAFTIYTQTVPDKLVRCCVGEVVSGLGVVEVAVQNSDPAKVITISNVGMVLAEDE